MKTNEKGIQLIRQFEGCKLTAYKCSANKTTIGYGNTFYEDGSAVKMGDKITKDRADSLFILILKKFEIGVLDLLSTAINSNQFSALVSFSYNAGIGNLKKSTLLKKVNNNPFDPSIETEFLKWDKAGGVKLNGLTKRRKAESELYKMQDS